jgi:hypothetical protein
MNKKISLVFITVISALYATLVSGSIVTEMISTSKTNGQEILKRSATETRKL